MVAEGPPPSFQIADQAFRVDPSIGQDRGTYKQGTDSVTSVRTRTRARSNRDREVEIEWEINSVVAWQSKEIARQAQRENLRISMRIVLGLEFL